MFQLISKDEMRSKLDLQWKTEEKECINIRSVEEDPHPSQHVLEKVTHPLEMSRDKLENGKTFLGGSGLEPVTL